AMSQQIHILRANTDNEIDAAFQTVTQQGIAALAVAAAPFFDTRRAKLVALAARHGVPTMYHFREFAEAGGLVSYGKSCRRVSPSRRLYRTRAQRRQGRRAAGDASHQVRVRDQFEDGEDARPGRAARTVRRRRRGD